MPVKSIPEEINTNFPIVIQVANTGKLYWIKKPEHLPVGLLFKVIETQVSEGSESIELYHGPKTGVVG